MARSDKSFEPTPAAACPTACPNVHRLDDHSERLHRLAGKIEKHDERLNLGDVSFAEVRKDIHSLTDSVKDLTGTIRWVGGLVIAAVIAAVLSGVLK